MNSQTRLIPLLLHLLTLALSLNNATAKTHWQDILVLKHLKQNISPSSLLPGSCISTWNFSFDPCDHISSEIFTCGFSCETVSYSSYSRITQIELDQAGYSASLSSLSWNLPFLTSLDLSGNNFSGPIPDSFSWLTRIGKLTLSHNSLSGSIPDSLGRLHSLEEIYLDYNAFQGPISVGFSGLVNLKRLELQGNRLSGELPNLSQLGNLYILDCSDNLFSGGFPTNLPAHLVEISIRKNQLTGNIPPQGIEKLPYLQVLDASDNQLTGSVPASLFTQTSLQQLSLANNKFTSVNTPMQFSLNSGLIAVDLSNNKLGGLLPGFLALMPKLSSLSLENNKLMGLIPTQYALKTVWPEPGMTQFNRLLLGGNYLFGPIPDPLMRMDQGVARVNLVDNCLFLCPISLLFCQGGEQKSLVECRNNIGPVFAIP